MVTAVVYGQQHRHRQRQPLVFELVALSFPQPPSVGIAGVLYGAFVEVDQSLAFRLRTDQKLPKLQSLALPHSVVDVCILVTQSSIGAVQSLLEH